jgi:hypothetical protein
VGGRVAELACVSVANQGLKRDVVARPGRRQCRVSVLGTADRRQAGRDERLERHHVRLAPGAFRELDGLARAPALWAWESRTCPGAQTQIDSSAFEVDIAAHHAPRRLKLQRKLEELLHAPDRDAVGHRPGMVSARPRRARSRTDTDVRALPHARYWAYGPPEEVGAEWRAVLEDGSNAGPELTLASSENLRPPVSRLGCTPDPTKLQRARRHRHGSCRTEGCALEERLPIRTRSELQQRPSLRIALARSICRMISIFACRDSIPVGGRGLNLASGVVLGEHVLAR